MKKILFYVLILTASLQVEAQTTLANKLRITGNTTDNTAVKVNVQSNDGTVNTRPLADVIEYLEFASAVNLPVTGVAGKLYLTRDNNRLYRWNGTIYVEVTVDISGKENTANKQNSLAVDGTGVKFPTVDAVNKNLTYLNVKSFGVVGDGLTDDSVAIQNAVNASAIIYFPQGVYNFNNIVVPSNRRIIGDGIGVTNFFLNSSTNPLFNISGTISVANSKVFFEGITFKHNKTHVISGNSGVFIVGSRVKNSGVNNCEFTEFNSYAIKTDNLDNNLTRVEGVLISNSIFRAAGLTAVGVFFDTESEYSTISNCRFHDLLAVRLINSANNIITSNVMINAGVYSQNDSTLNGGKITFTNNKVNHGGSLEIRNANTDSQYGSSIVGNEFLATSTHGLRLTGGKGNLVSGNRFWAISGRPIRIWDYLGNTGDNNIITGNVSKGIELVEDISTGTNNIIFNNIENNLPEVIKVDYATKNVSIGGSSQLIWDNVNKRLGLETSTPSQKFVMNSGTALFGTNVSNNQGVIQANGNITASAATLANQVVIKSQLDLKADLASPSFTGTLSAQVGNFSGAFQANSLAISGGTASQFLKANGTVDATVYAPLASPALTGTPTAPTATAGTNTTQIANCAFVTSAITGGVTLQNAYDNSTPSRITVTAAKGPLVIKNGEVAGTTKVLTVTSNADVETLEIRGNGYIDMKASSSAISLSASSSYTGAPNPTILNKNNKFTIYGSTTTGNQGGIVLDGSNLLTGTLVNFAFPNKSGTIALKSDLLYTNQTITANKTVTIAEFVNNNELILSVDATSGNITITLPTFTALQGYKVTVKKMDSSANTVSITGVGGVNIDGASTLIISGQYGTATVGANLSQYIIL